MTSHLKSSLWFTASLIVLGACWSCTKEEGDSTGSTETEEGRVTQETGSGSQNSVAAFFEPAAGPSASQAAHHWEGESAEPDAESSRTVVEPEMENFFATPSRPFATAAAGAVSDPEATAPVNADGVLGADGLRHHGTQDDPIPIDIDYLGAWEFADAENPFPDHVLALDGKHVKIRGFMLPDVDFEHITQFHLVRSLWGCCFGAPPRINEIVRVKVMDPEGVDYTYNSLEVIGKMAVIYEVEDGLIEDLYRMEGMTITELGFDDPEAPAGFDPATGFQGYIPEPSY